MTNDGCLSVFSAAALSVGALVVQVRDVAAAIEYANDLTDHGETVVVAPGVVMFAGPVMPEIVEVMAADMDEKSLTDIAVGMVYSSAAVAETGSVVLDGESIGDRVVAMLSEKLVVVLESRVVMPGLDEFGQWLTANVVDLQHIELMSGPSRTADIERVLTIGVQGPAEMHIVVIA